MTDLDIVPRAGWDARQPTSRRRIPLPTPEVFLHHSGASESGAAGVRSIQNYHMTARGYVDVAYSWLVDRDSCVIYEGRGPGIDGGHTFGHNSTSHGICVMGNFDNIEPSDELLNTIALLVAHGHTQGWWPAQLTGGHRDVKNTACPGQHLYDQIPTINARAAVLKGDPMPADPHVTRIQHAIESVMPGALDPYGADGLLGDVTASAVERMGLEYQRLAALDAVPDDIVLDAGKWRAVSPHLDELHEWMSDYG